MATCNIMTYNVHSGGPRLATTSVYAGIEVPDGRARKGLHMLRRLGPAGLLRLTAVITLGATLLIAGCAATPHSASPGMSGEKEGWARCEGAHSETLR